MSQTVEEAKKVVELKGFEPSAYTMRTYRSSQLSYSPTSMCFLNIHCRNTNCKGKRELFSQKVARGRRKRHLSTGFSGAVFAFMPLLRYIK